MLTRATRVLSTLLLVLAAVTVALPVTSATSNPPTCLGDGGVLLECEQGGSDGSPGSSNPGGGSGSGPSTPSCDLGSFYEFCIGTRACIAGPEWHPPYALPPGPKPSPDSEPMLRQCTSGPNGELGPLVLEIYWSTPGEEQPPSLAEQAQTAIARLDLSLPPLRTSPPNVTVVNLDTAYWLDGEESEQTSNSAFGLRLVATVGDLTIDPGDGSGEFSCPWTSSEEAALEQCVHTYTRSSREGSATQGGRPAYEVAASANWDLRVTYNGVTVTGIPGVPETLPGPSSTAVLRVDEIQGVVVSTD